jgi:UDP-N-acetylglucosamine 2-epimerase
MQIHLHKVKILQIHSARPEFVKNIMVINQSESNILI